MYLRSGERGEPMNNRLALRLAMFGGVALALFVILFFRLWFLQILNGSENLAEARNNRTREFRVSAPRGSILDRTGKVIVDNRTSLALQIDPNKLPPEDDRREREINQLAELTHSEPDRVRELIHEGAVASPGAPVTIRRDVGNYLVYYLEENQHLFPGVTVQRVFVRNYPDGTLAAHILGQVGEVTEEELKEPQYKGLQPGDEIGQDGVEETYDEFLRGKPGLTKIQVDAFGQPTQGGQLLSQPPVPGDNLRLSINDSVQEAGEAAMASFGLRGGFISMDIHTGEIIAMGSYPTFEPEVFTKPMTQAQVNALYRDEILAPLTDRAIAGLYPTGSTFKPITAIAALESSNLTPERGDLRPRSADRRRTDLHQRRRSRQRLGQPGLGARSVLRRLLLHARACGCGTTASSSTGRHELGIGRPSGIDLPGATEGLLPSQQWRDQLYKEGETERPWSAGDNVQLATGQGDLQTNPLQMAIAYAAIANGGTVVTPHVGLQVDDAAGRVLEGIRPRPRRHVEMDADYREDILEGMHDAAQNGGGTSCSVFCNFPIPVAGKTGTAQRPPYEDQSWYGVLAPYPNPRIVTFVTMEEGGFGVEAAAPAARRILEAIFAKELSEGSDLRRRRRRT